MQSQARWRAYSLENVFQMYSFQHSSGVNQSQFLLLKSFYFCSLLKSCVQNSSPYLRASGPKLLTVVCSVSSSELLDYFRLHMRFQCSGNIIEHIQDHFCLRKRTIIYPITNFICVIQLQPDGFLFEISNK